VINIRYFGDECHRERAPSHFHNSNECSTYLRTVTPEDQSSSGLRYANCAAARAAGVTPIYQGTSMYDANTHLDRDRDGITCG